MELIDKKQDTQGVRYYIAGGFSFITEDWQMNENQENKVKTKKQTDISFKKLGLNITKISTILFLILFVSTSLKAQTQPTDANIF